MNIAHIAFDRFNELQDKACHDRIRAARAKLGNKAVLLCHHYQRADVYQYADLTGDSLKLSRLASQAEAEYIVFCGVHFMAEVGETITPVTYINSAADLKAFCGDHGGIVCTSSNAGTIAQWAFKQREKILFFPDQHLGRWTGYKMGIPLDEMMVWDPDLEMGGLTADEIRKAKLLLWKGHCSVHQMFQPAHILKFRNQYPDGLVIAHPECSFEVCKQSDFVGSTEHIVKTITEAAPNTRWLVGTELNLVNRLAEEMRPEGKIVQFMAPTVCMCSTMQRIDPQHLAWTLENLAEGNIVNQIKVPEHEAILARLALERMLAASLAP